MAIYLKFFRIDGYFAHAAWVFFDQGMYPFKKRIESIQIFPISIRKDATAIRPERSGITGSVTAVAVRGR